MTTGMATGPTIPLTQTPTSALDVLILEERSAVLAAVLTAHPDLAEEAEVAARELLTAATIEGVAADVSSVLGRVAGADGCSRGVAAGIVAGLYSVRDPEGGTVLAYAGPEVPGELADDLMTEARRLGVVIADDVPDRLWPRWTDLA